MAIPRRPVAGFLNNLGIGRTALGAGIGAGALVSIPALANATSGERESPYSELGRASRERTEDVDAAFTYNPDLILGTMAAGTAMGGTGGALLGARLGKSPLIGGMLGALAGLTGSALLPAAIRLLNNVRGDAGGYTPEDVPKPDIQAWE